MDFRRSLENGEIHERQRLEDSHMELLQACVMKKIHIINMLTKSSVRKVVYGLHTLC